MDPPSSGRAAVVFDLDDTLVPWMTVGHWQWAWRPLGPVLSERRVLAAIRKRLHTWDRRRWQAVVGEGPAVDLTAHRAHLYSTLDAIAGHPLPSAEADAVVARFLRSAGEPEIFPDVVPALARLATEGIRVGVISALPADATAHALKRVGLSDLTVLRTAEPDVDPRLPAVAAYRAVAERLELKPSQILYVGDLFWSDVRAAARAGFATAFLDRRDWAPRVQRTRLRSLAELPEALKAPVEPPEDDGGPDPDSPA